MSRLTANVIEHCDNVEVGLSIGDGGCQQTRCRILLFVVSTNLSTGLARHVLFVFVNSTNYTDLEQSDKFTSDYTDLVACNRQLEEKVWFF